MDFSYLNPSDPRLSASWALSQRQGKESLSWVGGDWVLQKRPLVLFDNIKKGIEILAPISHLDAFASSRGEIIEAEDIFFYVLSPRVSGREIEAPLDGVFPEEDLFLQSLLSIKRSLDLICDLDLSHRAFTAPKNPIVASNMADLEWVRQALLKKLGKKITLPKEPEADMVVSHGDFALHNMLFQEKEIRLVDWSNVSAQPRYTDAAFLIGSILVGIDQANWPDLIEKTHLLAPYLAFDAWLAAVIIAIARSAAIWPSFHPGREGALVGFLSGV